MMMYSNVVLQCVGYLYNVMILGAQMLAIVAHAHKYIPYIISVYYLFIRNSNVS